MGWKRAGTALVGVVIGVAAVGVAASGQPGQPPRVVQAGAVSTYSYDPSGVAVDRWAVWVCDFDVATDISPDLRLDFTPTDAARVLTDRIAPYFEWLSDGAYRATFTGAGTLEPGPVERDEALTFCQEGAIAGSAGFEGAVVVLGSDGLSGEAVSGHEQCGEITPCTSSELPASRRRATLGGGLLFDTVANGPAELATAAHEIGHTLDWNHAHAGLLTLENYDKWPVIYQAVPPALRIPADEADFLAFREIIFDPATPPAQVQMMLETVNAGIEYGDVTDVMGITPSPRDDAQSGSIIQTMTFNRHAAGWIDASDIVVHPGGSQRVELAPIGVDGVQMLVLPTDDELVYYTLEARGSTPFFPTDDHSGVVVHRIDQRPQVCGRDVDPCWGEQRDTQAVGGLPFGFGQVMAPGEVREINGVRIEVVALDADGTYTVLVGTPPQPSTTQAPSRPPPQATPTFTG